MDKAKTAALRPYSFRELLERLFQIYRQNFLPFVGLVAVVQAPLTVITYLVDQNVQQGLSQNLQGLGSPGMDLSQINPADAQALFGPLFGGALLSLGVTLIAVFVQLVVMNCPLTYVASENYLGRPATLGQAFAALGKRLGTVIGGLLLFGLVVAGLFLVQIPILFACGLGIGVIVYVVTAAGALMVPVLLLERTSVTEGLRRSWTLGKSRLWPILGLTLGTAVASAALGLVVGLLIGALQDLVGTASAAGSHSELLSLAVGIVIAVLAGPIAPIGYTLLYYDARVRREGLDSALRTAQSLNPAATPADVKPPPRGKFIANEDFLNLAIVTMGTFVVILVYAGVTFLLSGQSLQF